MLIPPTLNDVYRARQVISRYLPRTPLVPAAALSKLLGCEVFLKLENCQPIGAFKVRGGLYLMSRLPEDQRSRGVITASTGNHGQSIAYAARTFGIRAIIGAPAQANPFKVQAMRDLGAEVVLTGRDFDEARLWVEAEAEGKGYRYIHSANEPDLIAGVGTVSLEVVEDLPDVDVIIVPIGAGSGACGHCLVAKAINPRVQAIGVQAERAPAVTLSWREKRMISTETADTFAEGVMTRVPFELTMGILWAGIDDILLVSEEELRRAIILLLEKAHQVAEGAGAAPLAAALKIRERLAGKKVVLVVSGGNITLEQLTRALTDPNPW